MQWLEYLGWNDKNLKDLRTVAHFYILEGKYEIATSFLEALMILDPNNTSDLQSLGALYLENKKPKEALKLFNQSLLNEPDHQVTLLNKSKALFELNQKKQAIALARSLIFSINEQVKNQAEALVLAYS